MARAYSNKFKLNVVAAALPAWLVGKAVNQVVLIANTDMGTAVAPGGSLYGTLNNAGLIDVNQTYGSPTHGIFAFSGGTIRLDNSELMIHGGGGAGAWAGNEVRGIILSLDQPVWRIVVPPTPVSLIRPRFSTPVVSDNQDGRPQAAHSFWGPVYDDVNNRVFRFRTRDEWQLDTGSFQTVDSAPYNGQWDLQTTRGLVPDGGNAESRVCLKHPSTGRIWVFCETNVREYNPTNDTWGTSISLGDTNDPIGVAVLDHTRNIIMQFARTVGVQRTINLATGALTTATLTGPYATTISGITEAVGMVFDTGLGKAVVNICDGFLYTLAYLSASSWYVDRLALDTDLTTLISGVDGHIYSRMQYAPNLRGIAMVHWANGATSGNRGVVFVRTS